MARPTASVGVLCLALSACSLEHPVDRFPDARRAEEDSADVSAATEDVVAEPDAPDASSDAQDITDAPALDAGGDAAADVVDANEPQDVPVGTDAQDVPVGMDAQDVPVGMDAQDVPVGTDAQDVPVGMDVRDVPVGADAEDVPVGTDAQDAGPPVYESCEAVRLAARPSGAYVIRAGATDPWAAYCDTSEAAGAWTLVLKADGRQRTFAYDAALWTNTALLNAAAANLQPTEAKFAGFLALPARAVRVQLVSPATAMYATARAVVVDQLSGAPLQRVFLDGGYVNVEGRTSEGFWEALVPNSRIQDRCNRRGLNVRSNVPIAGRVRIGMIGNENRSGECDSHDSWIGVGGGNASCGGADSNAVGNVACYAGRDNDRDIRSFAYVWVR